MLSNIILLAVKQIPGDQFFLTKWISIIFGYIINFIFNIVSSVTIPNSLGISIIFLTILARLLTIPITIKQQKSMFIMNKMSPELKKIQDKYAGRTQDPEIAKKMNMETQKLYAKYNYSPFSGCLPALIQLPIFIGLYYVMQYPSLFIDTIGHIFGPITEPDTIGYYINNLDNTIPQYAELYNLITEKIPNFEQGFDIEGSLTKILAVFTKTDWDFIKGIAVSQGDTDISSLITRLEEIVTFCGINLTETVSDNIMNFANLKFLIPIVSGVSTFLSSWLMTKRSTAVNEQARQQQKIMTIVMPFFMAFITLNLPCGVGVYWITSNIFQILQQIAINKIYSEKVVEDLLNKDKKKRETKK